jgi:hypothetical protein
LCLRLVRTMANTTQDRKGYATTKMSIRLTAHLLFVWFFNPKPASSKFSLRSSIGFTRITSHRRIILNFIAERSNYLSFFFWSFEIYNCVFFSIRKLTKNPASRQFAKSALVVGGNPTLTRKEMSRSWGVFMKSKDLRNMNQAITGSNIICFHLLWVFNNFKFGYII